MVIYRPPGQTLAPFLEELDGLLSSFVGDGSPILVFGNFNIHLEKPYTTDFHSLLASFDLEHLTTTSAHKSGNQLDFIYTRNCTADNILVEPLHISDHFFITFKLTYKCSSDWTLIKHNQTATNDSECSGTTGLQRAKKSPRYTSLYLLALVTVCFAARIKLETLMLAYRTTTGSAPTYFHSLMTICIPSRNLRRASE